MDQCSATPGNAQAGTQIYPSAIGSEIRTRPEISTFFSLHSSHPVILVNHRDGTQSNLTIEELELVLKYAKSERTRQKKEAEKANRQNIKYIQSL